jgi:hypothetical protein
MPVVQTRFDPCPYSDFSFVIRAGGCGGFLASVRAWGVTGQQQHGSVVSAEAIERGGAGGGVRSVGGGTKPASSEPSPAAKAVPMHSVAANAGIIYFKLFFDSNFIETPFYYFILIMS